jgi:hypothetical protein
MNSFLFNSDVKFKFDISSKEKEMNSLSQVIKIKSLKQIGMVVDDITNNMQRMWNFFGIGPWDVYEYKPGILQEVLYYGNPSKSGMKIAIAKLGNSEIELIEPLGQDNIYQDFLRKYGNGMQHLGWYIVDSESEFFNTIKSMENVGFSCIWSGRSPRGRFAYFDTINVLNTLLEMAWFDQGAAVQPSYIYPESSID